MRCKTPAGQQALDRLAAKLAPEEGPISIRVVNVAAVNAAAFPGRQIVLFNGLIQDAESPDELAGALGHEIGHLHRRDPTVGVIRDLAIGLLIGGSNGSALERKLLSTRYGRGQERGADQFAIDALRHANISPEPTAQLFARLGREEKNTAYGNALLGYVASHPMSAAREQSFKASSRPGHRYARSMTYDDWLAIREICEAPVASDQAAPVAASARKKKRRKRSAAS
jgi:predicted Zn-dependent protease